MIENEQCFQESAVASFVLMSFLILWAFLSLSLPPLPHSLFPSSPPTHCQLVSGKRASSPQVQEQPLRGGRGVPLAGILRPPAPEFVSPGLLPHLVMGLSPIPPRFRSFSSQFRDSVR